MKIDEKSAANKTAKHMNIGDYVQFGRYYDEPILWRVLDKIADGGVMLLSERILCLKVFDAAESGRADETGGSYTTNKTKQAFGSSEWSNSNIREWLNSSEQKVTYTTQPPVKTAIWDGYNAYADESGFLYNFTQDESDAIQLVKHDNVTDRVYLLSQEEAEKIVERKRKPTEIAVRNSEYELTADNNWLYWLRTSSKINEAEDYNIKRNTYTKECKRCNKVTIGTEEYVKKVE